MAESSPSTHKAEVAVRGAYDTRSYTVLYTFRMSYTVLYAFIVHIPYSAFSLYNLIFFPFAFAMMVSSILSL